MKREIVAAWADRYSGPGWSNMVVHYAYYQDGKLAVEAMQIEDFSGDMCTLFDVSAAANIAMAAAVRAALDGDE